MVDGIAAGMESGTEKRKYILSPQPQSRESDLEVE